MKNRIFFLLVFILLLPQFVAISQTKAKITEVDFSQIGGTIVVTYNIINAPANELYVINLMFVNDIAMVILPKTVSGDVGDSIPGGMNKKIIWELSRDHDNLFGNFQAFVSIASVTKMEKKSRGPGSGFHASVFTCPNSCFTHGRSGQMFINPSPAIITNWNAMYQNYTEQPIVIHAIQQL
jgi:hypothetical protein